ncbi:hypothetical protein [Pyxidicoccus xibeiensis]|uniref:hypothetical protein n=1 Tax=Pyxidicoccus xibeiensis TaxID=2906759 RepID=UPI0020A7037A|nr:hypothetical protein [Pyxidicoccus xibeiensis]MCP3136671.1 hypothetical protein [Pyxidicoccus xibeiensis]
MKPTHCFAVILFAVTLFFSSVASAQPCTSLTQSQFNWVLQGGGRFITITGVSLKTATETTEPVSSSFTSFLFTFKPARLVIDPTTGEIITMPARLLSEVSKGHQLFSNRVYSVTQNGVTREQPYSIFSHEDIELELEETGKMIIINKKLLNPRVAVSTSTCEGNMLTGFVGTTLYAFTFQQGFRID